MSSSLLEKTRKLNKLLQKTGSQPVVFSDICGLLSEVLNSDVFVISRKGKLLGKSKSKYTDIKIFGEIKVGESVSEELNEEMVQLEDTGSNLLVKDAFKNLNVNFDENQKIYMTVVPINGAGERLSTLVVYRINEIFTDDDLVLAEYGSTVVGIEVLRAKHEENEMQIRKRAIVQLAIGTLSYSELEAIIHIFNELDGNEGLLVASKIADRVGITRSVIVNALRKFESAGLIEARSLGMKGTHIKILNDKLMEELKKISAKS